MRHSTQSYWDDGSIKVAASSKDIFVLVVKFYCNSPIISLRNNVANLRSRSVDSNTKGGYQNLYEFLKKLLYPKLLPKSSLSIFAMAVMERRYYFLPICNRLQKSDNFFHYLGMFGLHSAVVIYFLVFFTFYVFALFQFWSIFVISRFS